MEELRLAIISLLNQSGMSLEQELFIIRDIYKDIDYTIEKQKKEMLKNGITENV